MTTEPDGDLRPVLMRGVPLSFERRKGGGVRAVCSHYPAPGMTGDDRHEALLAASRILAAVVYETHLPLIFADHRIRRGGPLYGKFGYRRHGEQAP